MAAALDSPDSLTSCVLELYRPRAGERPPLIVLMALPGAYLEEVGWRGCALPRLLWAWSALIASVVLWPVWGQ